MFDTWAYIIRPNKLFVEKESYRDDYCKVIIEPLDKGYGITVGNALRRILLSSIPGHAVTAVRIEGVYHEFTSIPGVREDVTDIILNLKMLRIRGYTDEPVIAVIDVAGPKKVYASDIKAPSQIEILNPDLYIATLDDFNTRLYMELVIEEGKGYLPSEERDLKSYPVGTILVDAVFSPILKVNFGVEQARVGRATDYDRLILEVWTNGAINALDAIKIASQIMKDHMELFSGISIQVEEAKKEEVVLGLLPEVEEKLKMKLEELPLSVRAYNTLKRKGINTVGDLVKLTRDELSSMKNIGRKSVEEVEKVLSSLGLSLGMNLEEVASNEAQKEDSETE
ncbi:MAG: DNA-directed RNA polymerase subunit alpha [Thermosulfidibacteraceae bacterium]|jgi:DNA-directed RNA polymerase subunit alpha